MLGILPYLHRLVPGNPILLRVVATASKRTRDLITRNVYLGALILIVIWALLTQAGGSGGGGTLAQLNKTSASLFQKLSFIQLALVALLAPVFTAGAITQERDSQTYDILLSTPLTNGQIVLGTLLSRVFFVVALLISGIPVFSITQIFGGVAISAIVASFLLAASTALVTGALATAIATFKVGTRMTIFYFYLFIAVFLVGGWQADRLAFMHPVMEDGKPSLTSWITGVHPFLALQTLYNRPDYIPPDITSLPASLRFWPVSWYLTSPVSFYVITTTVLSVALVLPSIVLLRVLAQTTVSPKTWALSKLKLARMDRTRPPRPVWNNPIAWREAKTKGSAARAVWLRAGFMILGLLGALVIMGGYVRTEEPDRYTSPSKWDRMEGTLTIIEGDKGFPYRIAPDLRVYINDQPSSLDNLKTRMMLPMRPQVSGNTITQINLVDIPRKISAKDARQYLTMLVLIEVAVILLVVTNTAASTVTREKVDGTLDLLLTSPITSRYYIWGKLRGLVYFVLPLIAIPVTSLGLFIAYDVLQLVSGSLTNWLIFPEAVLIMAPTLVVLAAFAAITGMSMSLRCRTTIRAVMLSVAVVLGICGMLGFCGNRLLIANNSDNLVSLAVAAFSPVSVLMATTDPFEFGGGVFGTPAMVDGARITLLLFSVAATAAYTAVVWSMYRNMVKNFDMTIRRQSR